MYTSYVQLEQPAYSEEVSIVYKVYTSYVQLEQPAYSEEVIIVT